MFVFMSMGIRFAVTKMISDVDYGGAMPIVTRLSAVEGSAVGSN